MLLLNIVPTASITPATTLSYIKSTLSEKNPTPTDIFVPDQSNNATLIPFLLVFQAHLVIRNRNVNARGIWSGAPRNLGKGFLPFGGGRTIPYPKEKGNWSDIYLEPVVSRKCTSEYKCSPVKTVDAQSCIFHVFFLLFLLTFSALWGTTTNIALTCPS